MWRIRCRVPCPARVVVNVIRGALHKHDGWSRPDMHMHMHMCMCMHMCMHMHM